MDTLNDDEVAELMAIALQCSAKLATSTPAARTRARHMVKLLRRRNVMFAHADEFGAAPADEKSGLEDAPKRPSSGDVLWG